MALTELEAHWLSENGCLQAQGSACLHLSAPRPLVLWLQVCTDVPTFLCGCWGFALGSSPVLSKHSSIVAAEPHLQLPACEFSDGSVYGIHQYNFSGILFYSLCTENGTDPWRKGVGHSSSGSGGVCDYSPSIRSIATQ